MVLTDINPRVEDLTGSKVDDEETLGGEVVSSPSGLSSNSDSNRSSLYNDGSQTFLSVAVIDVDEDPTKNIKPLPVYSPILVMLPGPSVLRSLILIEEEVDVLNDPWFIPPSLHGDDTAGPDIPQEEEEVKEEEPEGKVAGTPEFWAGDYME